MASDPRYTLTSHIDPGSVRAPPEQLPRDARGMKAKCSIACHGEQMQKDAAGTEVGESQHLARAMS